MDDRSEIILSIVVDTCREKHDTDDTQMLLQTACEIIRDKDERIAKLQAGLNAHKLALKYITDKE